MRKFKIPVIIVGFATYLMLVTNFALRQGNDLVTIATMVLLIVSYSIYNTESDDYTPMLLNPMLIIIALVNFIEDYQSVLNYFRNQGFGFFSLVTLGYIPVVMASKYIPLLLGFNKNHTNEERDIVIKSALSEAKKKTSFWIASILSLILIVTSYTYFMTGKYSITEINVVIGGLIIGLFLIISISIIKYVGYKEDREQR